MVIFEGELKIGIIFWCYPNINMVVRNDLILKMTPGKKRKIFITSQKLDCLAQHPKKLLNQNDTYPDREGKITKIVNQ